MWKRLRDDEHVYGFGEKTGRLDKRGRNLRRLQPTRCGTRDTYAYGDDTDPIYAPFPFYIVLRNGRAHGIFFDNTYRSIFDIGRESQACSRSAPRAASSTTTSSTGPRRRTWSQRYTRADRPHAAAAALGARLSTSAATATTRSRGCACIADTFREKRIPADVIWLDIHYLEGYNPFTWDRERFPDPGADDRATCAAQGFQRRADRRPASRRSSRAGPCTTAASPATTS